MTHSSTHRKPFVALFFVVLNIVVFFLMIVSGVSVTGPSSHDALHWGANYGPLTWQGQPWRLITSLFVHSGFVHLFFNMWNLFYVGRLAESMFGSLLFLTIYIISGIVGG